MSRLIRPLSGAMTADQLKPPNIEDILAKLAKLQDAAKGQAAAILRQAHISAEKIRVDTQRMAEKQGHAQGLEKGMQAGLEAGRKAGIEELRAQVEPVKALLGQLLAALDEERKSLRKRALKDMVDLALGVAETVIKSAIAHDPSVVERNLTRALELTLSKSRLEVLIHPSEVERIEKLLPDLKDRFGELEDFMIVADERVTAGGCIVRSAEGSVDADIETQLAGLRRALVHG